MMTDQDSGGGTRPGLLHLVVGTLLFGSIWGLSEATLGGFLNLIIFPNKGAIMGGIGAAIMAAALAAYRKPAMLPGIGVVAASFKLLNVWLLFVPINAVHVVNPATAIILESLAFALVAAVAMNRTQANALAAMGAGALAGLLSATAYVYFAIYATHSNLLGRGITTVQAFVTNQGVVQAAFFAALAPLGYVVGGRLVARTARVLSSRPRYYAASAAAIGLCWGISALALVLL